MVGPVLSIRDLQTELDTDDGVVHAVEQVSYDVYPGETLAEALNAATILITHDLGLACHFHHEVAQELAEVERDVGAELTGTES